jgi:phenylacetate-CoA ligase
MSIGLRHLWNAVDFCELARLFPPPPEYFEHSWYAEPEEIDRVKLSRARDRADRAYRVPFFRRLWDANGFEPGDLRTLDDLARVPTYTVEDIRQSIEEHPPYGDYQGVSPDDALREPLRMHMSGGTTGEPRPTLYTQWDRGVSGVLNARAMYMQGLRSGDVVINSWTYGLHNGAFSFDESLQRWLNCLVITASAGTVTSTRKQLDLARRFKAAAILTTGDYLLRIVEEARAMGLDPRRDLFIRALATNVGNEDLLEKIFGIPAYATYGFHEVGTVAVECPAKEGLHIFEDAFNVDVVDVDTGESLPDGEIGALVVTEFYKTGSPQFRYNIMDLSMLHPRERCACGSWLRRMGRFAGRGDTMVKLRGVNVWPEGIGKIATSIEGTVPDYFVRALTVDGKDALIVSVVSNADPNRHYEIRDTIEQRLHDQLGVRIGVEVVAPGSLDQWTGQATSKAKRFRDERQGERRPSAHELTPRLAE